MKKLPIFFLIILSISACSKSENVSEKDIAIISKVKNAVNENDYSIIQPLLTHNFTLSGMDPNTSYTSLYAYLNFKSSAKITEISIKRVEQFNDSINSLKGRIHFKDYKSEKFELRYNPNENDGKITYISTIRPHKFSLTTRATYNSNLIFGNDRAKNINNLSVLDYSQADSFMGAGYQIYYDQELEDEAKFALNQFNQLIDFLSYRFKLQEIEKQSLYLTEVNSSNTIVVGTDRYIPWTFPMYESDSVNMDKLSKKIGNTFSHEIVEETLVHSYKLRGYKYRWFNDGVSEYMAYHYCMVSVPDEGIRYFFDNRLAKASEFKQDGNLLDWRGNGPIESVDQGKLYGDRFIYNNDVGQYGRAFKYFKDTFENREALFLKLLTDIKLESSMTPEKLLDMLSAATGTNAIDEISKY
ncbi:hypothetical protein [Roseivirga misakiensis]|uniref:Uncharacterized protein n=1 Tax=Roseivirga misakiensis TaxID=1563681 RepID=A0A1E5SLC3_9BACT|nr:hypothetical protein [Roseivirga misakiensis]OEJ99893.1 hypothetical protein BFP71_10115 [Roseivirga misakiensis]